jgi:DNA (cytosine-5)-methyltransferase 1
MRAVDLFCGAGGASLGLERAGYTVTGFDYWSRAVDTHNLNGLLAYEHNPALSSCDAGIPECDLLWASPPCQPFSAAGDGEGEADERDGFPWALRIIGRLLPKVVIFENVKGITFDKHSEYFGSVLLALTGLGYEWDWTVLNSADYGVPQTRERCFIVARRDGGRIVWPAPTHTLGDSLFLEPWVTMAEALGWGGGEYVLDYRQTNVNGEPITCDLTDRPSPTIGTQSQSQWIVNETIRLTIAELALLQGFPADYQWTGTKTDQARQVGNAVPPVMAQVLAEANRPVTA